MKKIQVYNVNQYTKTGKQKKNATAEMSLSFVDVSAKTEAEATKQRKDFNEYVAKTLKARGYHSFVSPYFFTHINAVNDKGEAVRIFETLTIGSDNKELTTTPKSIYELLTK